MPSFQENYSKYVNSCFPYEAYINYDELKELLTSIKKTGFAEPRRFRKPSNLKIAVSTPDDSVKDLENEQDRALDSLDTDDKAVISATIVMAFENKFLEGRSAQKNKKLKLIRGI